MACVSAHDCVHQCDVLENNTINQTQHGKQQEKKYLHNETKVVKQHMALFNCTLRSTSVCA